MGKIIKVFRNIWFVLYKYKESIASIGLLIYTKLSIGFLNWYISLISAILLTVGLLKVSLGIKIPIINNFIRFTEPERTVRWGSNPESVYCGMEDVVLMLHYNTEKRKILERGILYKMLKKIKIGFTWIKKNYAQLIEIVVACGVSYMTIAVALSHYLPALDNYSPILKYAIGGVALLIMLYGIVKKDGIDGLATISTLILQKEGLDDEVNLLTGNIKDVKLELSKWIEIKNELIADYEKDKIKVVSGVLTGVSLESLEITFKANLANINRQIDNFEANINKIANQIKEKTDYKKTIK